MSPAELIPAVFLAGPLCGHRQAVMRATKEAEGHHAKTGEVVLYRATAEQDRKGSRIFQYAGVSRMPCN